MKTFTVRIEGVTPLICNRFTDEAQLNATNGTRTAVVGGDKGTPKEIAEKKLYLDTEGKICIPGPNLFRSIIDAGTFFKSGKSKVTTQKSSVIPAAVSIPNITIPMESKEGWAVDTRPVRNPSTGGRFLCYRPSFNDWALNFSVELDEEIIHEKLLREILDAAGKRIGLGDFRPSCKGPFGKFVVTKWKQI